MSATSDREQVNAAINTLVERATSDPSYAAELSGDAVGYLKAAGVPESMLAALLKAEGLEEAEVQGYALGPDVAGPPVGTWGGDGGAGIIIGTICVGTCRSATIVVGCTRSFIRGL